MVEQQRKRVEDQIASIVEELDRSYIRKMQGDMHRCAASCCDNKDASVQKVQSCVDNCNVPFTKVQHYVQSEFERVQNRLQRCIMECNDNIKDKMGLNPSQSEINKLTEQFDKCAIKCVDNFCDLLPAFAKTLKKTLASEKFD